MPIFGIAWIAIKFAASRLFVLARMVPVKVWVAIAIVVCAWVWHGRAVRHADTAGYQRSEQQWIKRQQDSAIAQQLAYMRAETVLWNELNAARKTTDSRMAQIQAKAKTLQGKLDAIRAADPPEPDCQLSDQRVQWANCAIGYTDACGAM